jgi:hypothetical protein
MTLGEILHHPVSRLLVLCNLALATLVVLRLVYPAATLSALHFGNPSSLPSAAPPTAKPIQIASAQSYAAIADRPLFIETRRMPKDEPPPAAAPSEVAVSLGPASALDGLTLSGIVMSGGTRVALVKAATGESPPALKEGDEFRGWHVEKIEAEAVVLTAQGEEKRIEFPKGKQESGISIGKP